MEIFEGLIEPKTNNSQVVLELNTVSNAKGVQRSQPLKRYCPTQWPLATCDDLSLFK